MGRASAARQPPEFTPTLHDAIRPQSQPAPERGILAWRVVEEGLMRYVLNSAVISRPGHYEYKLLTGLEAEVWLKLGRFTSRVGHKAAAEFLENHLGIHCPLSRESIAMQPGDEGLKELPAELASRRAVPKIWQPQMSPF
jgi:Domain of unknown function (DUF1874)